jgi:DNA-binding response OmpR family regulator
MKILVVEDNLPVAGVIISAVEAAGHGVVGHSRSVDQSLRLLSECDCDVVILDVDLMGLNSAPVAEELKKRNIPFLVVTGSPQMMMPAHRDAPFVFKPFRIDGLIKSLSEMQR